MGKRILAIDPGTTQSAFVVYEHLDGRVPGAIHQVMSGVMNVQMLNVLREATVDVLLVETVACYGQRVGREVFQTCIWIGRFIQEFVNAHPLVPVFHVYRKPVVRLLCNSVKARDAEVRAVLIDRFGPGKELAVGKKKTPGPLYNVKSDAWSALAVAVAYCEGVETDPISREDVADAEEE